MKGKDILHVLDSAFTEFEEGMKDLRFNTISKLQKHLRTAYTADEYSHRLSRYRDRGKKVHSA